MEYEGAVYHVINRGNYRRDLFETAGAAQSFVGALEEVVQRYDWRLQAYVLMINHFHLVVETPHPNLQEGMHWLLSTTATRFNRFRQERGHLFQGRYQALPIEDTRLMGHVIDYVHLNPARAGVVAADQLSAFRWSSLSRFVRGPRFTGLAPEGALNGHGLQDTPAGWADYLQNLVRLANDKAEQKRLGHDGFCKGWAIGTAGWRKALAKEYASSSLTPGLAAHTLKELREVRWTAFTDQALLAAGKTRQEAISARKTELWKLELAQQIRDGCGAPVAWLARELRLGADATARSLLSKLKK